MDKLNIILLGQQSAKGMAQQHNLILTQCLSQTPEIGYQFVNGKPPGKQVRHRRQNITALIIKNKGLFRRSCTHSIRQIYVVIARIPM